MSTLAKANSVDQARRDSLLVVRTLELDQLHARFLDGPIPVDGYPKFSIQAITDTGTWSGGEFDIEGGVNPGQRVALATPITITNAARHTRTGACEGEAFLDANVTTAQSGITLKVWVLLYGKNQ